MKATAKDLRFHSKEILESTMRGEEVVITFHGKPTAKVVPYKQDSEKISEHSVKEEGKAFGMWQDREDMNDVNGFVRNLRKGRQ